MSRKEKRKEFTQYSYQHRLQHFDYSLASLDFQCSIRNMIMVWHTNQYQG